MNINHEKISQIIRDVASEKIVPRFRQLEEGHIRTKSSPTDLVTIADEEAEIELTRIFKDIMPGCQVIGEEAVSSGAITRDAIQTSDDYIWIVDPVDGTGNFARGEPVFGTMVSAIKSGERIASWIYQIPRQRMISARKGEGVQIDGTQFEPSAPPPDDLPFNRVSAFISNKFMPHAMRPAVDAKIQMLNMASTFMCCAWEYIDVLEGQRTFSLYKRIEPWDHQAGALILEEAGFCVRKWDGSQYSGRDLSGGLINAPSEALWNRIYAEFLKEPLATIRPGP